LEGTPALLDRPSAPAFGESSPRKKLRKASDCEQNTEDCSLPGKRSPATVISCLKHYRRQGFMGELPHQWVEIYHSCECGEFMKYWIKFSDGIAVECRTKQPGLGRDFFADESPRTTSPA
jgi:hypothetical protein